MASQTPVRPPAAGDETAYERNQQYSALTRYLHGFRFRQMMKIVGELRSEIPDRPLQVFEIGAAAGKLYATLDAHFPIEYRGIELDEAFVQKAIERHGARPNFEIRHGSAADPALWSGPRPDLVVALETLEHIPERYVFRVIENVAAAAPRRFIASVPVEVGPAIWIKNLGSLVTGYNRHKGRPWSEVFWGSVYATNRLPVHGTGHRGFDWRWLGHTIRHYMNVREIRKSPFQWVPSPFAMSVMFVAESRG